MEILHHINFKIGSRVSLENWEREMEGGCVCVCEPPGKIFWGFGLAAMASAWVYLSSTLTANALCQVLST